MGSAGRRHDMVDWPGQIPEERLQRGRIVDIEGCDFICVSLTCCHIQAISFACREDDSGTLSASAPGGLQPDAGAAADDDDGLVAYIRFTRNGSVAMTSPHRFGCAITCLGPTKLPAARRRPREFVLKRQLFA